MNLNPVDLGIVIAIAVGLFAGIKIGFLRLTLPLAAAVAVWMALRYQPEAALWLIARIHLDPALAQALAYVVVALGAIVATAIVGAILRFAIAITFTGWLDHLAGAGAGLILGSGVAALLVVVLEAFGGPEVGRMVDESDLVDPLRDLWALGLKELEKYRP